MLQEGIKPLIPLQHLMLVIVTVSYPMKLPQYRKYCYVATTLLLDFLPPSDFLLGRIGLPAYPGNRWLRVLCSSRGSAGNVFPACCVVRTVFTNPLKILSRADLQVCVCS